jgi:hypothetical protein
MYWYLTTREGGKVRQRYCPVGLIAQCESQWPAMRRELRELERAALEAARRELREPEGFREFARSVDGLVGAAMMASGCHKTYRTWRRRRGKMGEVQAKAKVAVPAEGPETDELMKRAAKGDKSVLPRVHALLNSERGTSMIHSVGSLAIHIRHQLIDAIAGKDILCNELLHRKTEDMCETLAGPEPSLVEQLLAERVALLWLMAYRADQELINQANTPITTAQFRQQAATQANARLNAAIKTLAQVRKLALPVLKLKLGQMNVAVGAQQVVNERG